MNCLKNTPLRSTTFQNKISNRNLICPLVNQSRLRQPKKLSDKLTQKAPLHIYGIESQKLCACPYCFCFFPTQDLTLKNFGTFFVNNSLRFVGSSPSKNDTVPLCRWLDFLKTMNLTKFIFFRSRWSSSLFSFYF